MDLLQNNFPWLQSSADKIINQIQQKTAATLLLYGIAGIGKTKLALSVSRYILCERANHDLKISCGVCRNCKQMQNQQHPDFFHLMPDERGNIKIDAIRKVLLNLQTTIYQSQYRIILIEQVETLTIGAANALLKNLEEPMPQTLFILTTNQLSNLLPTILSRCIKIRVPMPNQQELREWLQLKGWRITELELKQFISLYNHAPFKILAALEQNELKLIQEFHQNLQEIYQKRTSIVTASNRWQETSLVQLLDWFYIWLYHISLQQNIRKFWPLFIEIATIKRLIHANIAINKQLALEHLLVLLKTTHGRES